MKVQFERSDLDVLIGLHTQETISAILVSENDYAYLYDEFKARSCILKEDDWWFKTTYGFSVHHDTLQEDYFTN
jgi:hypothetical protein